MKTNLWKTLLVAACVTTLLMLLPGVTVQAEESQEEIPVGDGVTATLDTETGSLELYSQGGTLWNLWSDSIDKDAIKSIKVASGTVNLPANSSGIFAEFYNLISIDMEGFNTAEVTDMSHMFEDCRSLTGIAAKAINTNNVTNMSYMFKGCESLVTLEQSVRNEYDYGFDTYRVTDMSHMFEGCQSLKKYTRIIEADSVTDMSYMFADCKSITYAWSLYGGENLIDTSYMFAGCQNLKSVDYSNLSFRNVKKQSYMYKDCVNLYQVMDLYASNNTTEVAGMFFNCRSLQELDLHYFDLSNCDTPDSVASLFEGCTGLEKLKTPNHCSKSAIELPVKMYDEQLNEYYELTEQDNNKALVKNPIGVVDIADCDIELSDSSFVYDGTAKTPSVTITGNDKTLELDKEYTVSYLNNTNAGTATVTVSGTGYYKGEVTLTFAIEKATPELKFANGNVSKTCLDNDFTNELTATTDGTITYKSNNTSVAYVDSANGVVTIKGAGTASITATAATGDNYKAGNATFTLTVTAISIEKASVSGVSLSYGYSGRTYTPVKTVKVGGVTLTENKDYVVRYEDNVNPGIATIKIIGIGNYTGTRIKKFEIVDCVSELESGKTYQIIPKNNSATAVCSYVGRMVNNTKVYITNRSSSEAMRFKAVKNADGTWKFINAKCELALAVQQNSYEIGKKLVLYDQTTRKAQNWRLLRKSDNSFAIINSVSGLYIAMSDVSAVKGTTLSMQKSSGRGEQRFYIAETSPVNAPFDGTYSVRASKNKAYSLNVDSASRADGANVNLYTYSNTSSKKFKAMYSGAGYYRLVNVNSGLVLTVEGNTRKSGANVIQSRWKAQSGQRWKIVYNSDGTFTMKNALGTVLQLSGNKTVDGSNVVARKASTTGAQKWYLG